MSQEANLYNATRLAHAFPECHKTAPNLSPSVTKQSTSRKHITMNYVFSACSLHSESDSILIGVGNGIVEVELQPS